MKVIEEKESETPHMHLRHVELNKILQIYEQISCKLK